MRYDCPICNRPGGSHCVVAGRRDIAAGYHNVVAGNRDIVIGSCNVVGGSDGVEPPEVAVSSQEVMKLPNNGSNIFKIWG